MKRVRKISVLTLILLLINMVVPSFNYYITYGVENEIEQKQEITANEEHSDEYSALGDATPEIIEDGQSTIKDEIEFLDFDRDVNYSYINPRENHKLTGDFLLKGSSPEEINGVEVYVDDKYVGHATLEKTSNGTNFKYPIRGLSNGSHKITIVIYVKNGGVVEDRRNITVDNTKTLIMGTGTSSVSQMIMMLYNENPSLSYNYIKDFVNYTISEARIEGVNHDILFAQMMHETGYLKFGGDVKPEQNNFAGIGATGNGEPGHSFPSVQIGIRAVVQHLKAYASTEPLKLECVDPRFKYVKRGSAIYVEYLGIQENPDGNGWAASVGYGDKVKSLVTKLKSINAVDNESRVVDLKVNGDYVTGNKLTVSALAIPMEDTLYKLWVCNRNNNEWEVLSDYSTRNEINYVPHEGGRYSFVVHVKHKNSSNSDYDDFFSVDINVKEGPAKITTFEVLGNAQIDEKLTIKATAAPIGKVEYKFSVREKGASSWTTLQEYSEGNEVYYIPKKSTTLEFAVYSRIKGTSVAYDDFGIKELQINTPTSKAKDIKVIGNAEVGEKLTFNAIATPSDQSLYKLWVCDRSTQTWTVLSDYSVTNSIDFTPQKAGKYSFVAHVKHIKSNQEYDDFISKDIEVREAYSQAQSISVTGEMMAGYKLNFTATANPADRTLYKLWVCDRTTGEWTVLSEYSTKNSIEYIPKKAGKYSFVAHVKHRNSKNEYDSFISKDVNVTGVSSNVQKVTVDGSAYIGNELTFSATATPSEDTLYKLWVCDRTTGEWIVLSDYSKVNTAKYIPVNAGKHSFVVHVKHKTSNSEYDSFKSIDVDVQKLESKINSINVIGDKYVGNELTFSATATPSEDTLYKLWVCDRNTGEWIVLSEYSSINIAKYTPANPGRYSFVVHVKHKQSKEEYDAYKSVDVDVQKNESKVTNFTVSGRSGIGEKLTITADALPIDKTLYKFWVCDRTTGEWIVLKDYSSSKTVEYIPRKSGKYSFVVHVKHVDSKNQYDDLSSRDIFIGDPKPVINNFELKGELKPGSKVTMSASAIAGSDVLYKFWVANRLTGEWIVVSDYSTKNTVEYVVPSYGTYSFVVHVKRKEITSNEPEVFQGINKIIKQDKLIVIDPGHGATDPGAVKYHNGIKYSEDEMNMGVALKLEKSLIAAGYNVFMTRTPMTTSFITLERRTELANYLDAELFISIHHNSAGSTATGVEVFYSKQGVDSNVRDYLIKAGHEDPNKTLASRVSRSSELSSITSKNISNAIGISDRGGRYNTFYVNRNVKMPSILVECGFLTNPTEAALLKRPETQQKIADAIAKSL